MQHYAPLLARPDLDDEDAEDEEILDDEDFEDEADGKEGNEEDDDEEDEEDEEDEDDEDAEEPWQVHQAGLTSSDESTYTGPVLGPETSWKAVFLEQVTGVGTGYEHRRTRACRPARSHGF